MQQVPTTGNIRLVWPASRGQILHEARLMMKILPCTYRGRGWAQDDVCNKIRGFQIPNNALWSNKRPSYVLHINELGFPLILGSIFRSIPRRHSRIQRNPRRAQDAPKASVRQAVAEPVICQGRKMCLPKNMHQLPWTCHQLWVDQYG